MIMKEENKRNGKGAVRSGQDSSGGWTLQVRHSLKQRHNAAEMTPK